VTKDQVLEPDPMAVSDSRDAPNPLVNFFDRLPEWLVDSLTPEQKFLSCVAFVVKFIFLE